MLAGLDNNAVVKFLGNENDAQYLKEAIIFFFCVGIVQGVGARARKDLVSCVGLSFLRAFGDLNIALALGLGSMPGEVFKNLDHFMHILVAAIAFCWFSDKFIPGDVSKNFNYISGFCYSMIKANNAGAGYAAAAAALPGSWWAPIIGAYLGVNGARLIENGVSSITKKPDNDDLLAIAAGTATWILTTHLAASALLARAILVLFHYSTNYINYQDKYAEIVSGATAGASKARGRSSTPKRK